MRTPAIQWFEFISLADVSEAFEGAERTDLGEELVRAIRKGSADRVAEARAARACIRPGRVAP